MSRLYVAKGREVRPLLEAILAHPDLYDAAQRMVKPPVVQAAGMLRAVGRGIDTTAWAWLCDSAGQYLFMPPNVSGWDDTRWLDTATFRARWQMAQYICEPGAARSRDAATGVPPTPPSWSTRAIALLGLAGALGAGARRARALRRRHAWPPPTEHWKKTVYPVLALNALRMLVATSPDYLTS